MPYFQFSEKITLGKPPSTGAFRVETSVHERLKKEIKAKGWTQQEVAERLELDAANLSRMLNGKRRLPTELAQKIAQTIGLDALTIVGVDSGQSVSRVPVVSLGEIPMALKGKELFRALQEVAEETIPDVTGENNVVFVRLDDRQSYFGASGVWVSLERKPRPGKKVVARLHGTRFVGVFQLAPDGSSQVADANGLAHSEAEVVGVVRGGVILEED